MRTQYYRLDIQGLRAVAVVLVFFAHASWKPFLGGFIGVDIFFVISGYVITGLLYREYLKKQDIRLSNFYARRLFRLLPALMVVVFLTLFMAFFWFPPSEQIEHYNGSMSTVLWLSNFFFLLSDLNYFSPASTDKLFLHTWSLGVEEQFYLTWPLILLFILKLSRRKNLKSITMFILAILCILSFSLSIFYSGISNTYSFFLMPMRFWQFGVGGLLAVVHIKKYFSVLNQKQFFTEAILILGVAMILFATFLFDNSTLYPNWQVLIPTLGTVFVIMPNYNKTGYYSISKILSSKPLVFFGDISYSFYLWHWTLLVINKRMYQYIPILSKFEIFILTFVLSVLTYIFIEKPFRKMKLVSYKPSQAILVALTAMAASVLLIVLLKDYSSALSNTTEQSHIYKVRKSLPKIYSMGCVNDYFDSIPHGCGFGSNEATQNVILFGDSILLQWFTPIQEYYLARGWRVYVFGKLGCPIIDKPYFNYRLRSVYKSCDKWRNLAIKKIIDLEPDTILIGNSTGYPFKKEEWISGTLKTINRLNKNDTKITIIAGTPKLGFDGPICIARENWISKFFTVPKSLKCFKRVDDNPTWSWQKEISKKFPSVRFINFNQLVCPNNECVSNRNGLLVFRDSMHLSEEFVKSSKAVITQMLNE